MSRETQLHRFFYESLLESQYWPADRMREHQREQLGRLVRHASARVPFYKDRLDVLDADGELDWARWSSLPILRREELLTHREGMQATSLAAGHGYMTSEQTSGSTGAPITVSRTSYCGAAQAGAFARHQRNHELDWARDVLLIAGADTNSGTLPTGDWGATWGPPWLSSATGRRVRLNRFPSPAQFLDFMADHQIGYLSCRPKVAQAIALEALDQRRSVPLDAVLTFGTGVQEDEVDDFKRAFGARAVSVYSSTEAQLIACQCPQNRHFHVGAEQILVELLDDAGQPVPPGALGRVVVTPFFNFAQPLIRYDQGDLAIASDKACDCGRTSPIIERIVGRRMNLFRFPDGTRVAPVMPGELRTVLNAKYWQIAQVGPLSFEVRYVPFEGGTHDEATASQIVRQFTHTAAQVTFAKQDDLARLPGGKYVEYVCELKEPAP